MVKVLFGIKRRPDRSEEEFGRYWRDVHAPIVKEVADTLNIKGYVQTLAVHPDLALALAAGRGARTEFDGFAELWWDSEVDLRPDGPKAREAVRRLLADETEFMDLARSVVFLGEERTVI